MNRKHYSFLTLFLAALFSSVIMLATVSPTAAQTTFSYTGPPVPIQDGDGTSGTTPGARANVPLVVSGLTGTIFDVNFRIDGSACNATAGSATNGVDHSFVSDLEFTLTSPNGTSVKIIDNTDGNGNNFCQTLLDDESSGPSIQSVVSAQAPFTGTFTPASPLSAFDGGNPNGTWTLSGQDFFAQDTGNIRAFSLIFTPRMATAATVSVGGRVTNISGAGIANISMTMTGSTGNVRTATTTASGYYQFDDVQAGETYILSATGKRYTFSQPVQVLNVNEETTEVNFTANSEKRLRVF